MPSTPWGALLDHRPKKPDWTPEVVSAAKAEEAASIAKLWAEAPDVTPMHPGRAVVEVQKEMPDDTLVVGGGGSFGLWAMRYRYHNISAHIKSQKQGSTSAGFAYAMGLALAAKEDGRRVFYFGGDGSFQFYLSEIETAVRYELPIVFIVGYDQGWADEVDGQLAQFGRTYEVDHEFVRLDKVSEAMGGHGEYVTATADVAPAVRRALDSGKPAVVQLVIDRDINAHEIDRTGLSGSLDWDHVIGGLGAPGTPVFAAH
ncbi:thiamine pyrophosphate-dependent enzyme [Yinghuangia aomiensis]